MAKKKVPPQPAPRLHEQDSMFYQTNDNVTTPFLKANTCYLDTGGEDQSEIPFTFDLQVISTVWANHINNIFVKKILEYSAAAHEDLWIRTGVYQEIRTS